MTITRLSGAEKRIRPFGEEAHGEIKTPGRFPFQASLYCSPYALSCGTIQWVSLWWDWLKGIYSQYGCYSQDMTAIQKQPCFRFSLNSDQKEVPHGQGYGGLPNVVPRAPCLSCSTLKFGRVLCSIQQRLTCLASLTPVAAVWVRSYLLSFDSILGALFAYGIRDVCMTVCSCRSVSKSSAALCIQTRTPEPKALLLRAVSTPPCPILPLLVGSLLG